MSYEKYLKTDSSVLLRNCHEEARKYVGCIEASLLIFIELFTFGIILIPLMYFNFFSTILILSILIIFSLFYILITKIFINKWAKRQVYLVAETFKTLKHSFQLFKYIKLKNKKNFFFNRYNVAVNEYQNCIRNFTFTKQLPKYLIETILIVLISSVFLVNYSDSSSISKIIPLLALYTAAALRLIPGLNRILSYVQVIYNSIPSLKILHHDLTNSSKLISNDKQNYIEKIKKLTFSDKIEIKNLSYKYEGSSQKIINNLNITIKKGEKICITGESGQGKTTFIDLLTGLLRPNSGEIIVDGKKIIDHLDDWKKLINFTPQSVTLISDSLEKNITLNENSSQEIQRKAYEALKNSHFNKLKNDEIFNLSLTIGEEAKGLSGGQAQRVAIARSLYEKGEIFIFDEFTSSLDQETSQKVLENIFKILKGKTIIIISHRPQLSHYFDVIYKLENKNNITLLKKV